MTYRQFTVEVNIIDASSAHYVTKPSVCPLPKFKLCVDVHRPRTPTSVRDPSTTQHEREALAAYVPKDWPPIFHVHRLLHGRDGSSKPKEPELQTNRSASPHQRTMQVRRRSTQGVSTMFASRLSTTSSSPTLASAAEATPQRRAGVTLAPPVHIPCKHANARAHTHTHEHTHIHTQSHARTHASACERASEHAAHTYTRKSTHLPSTIEAR